MSRRQARGGCGPPGGSDEGVDGGLQARDAREPNAVTDGAEQGEGKAGRSGCPRKLPVVRLRSLRAFGVLHPGALSDQLSRGKWALTRPLAARAPRCGEHVSEGRVCRGRLCPLRPLPGPGAFPFDPINTCLLSPK